MVKMECTTTNSRQNNERLKNRLSFKLLIAVFYWNSIHLSKCLLASLPLFVFTVDTQLHTHMLSSCNAQICRKHAHPHKFKHTHTHTEGLVFFLRVEYVFGSIISLWYWAILHMLKGMCWRCGEKVGRNTHTHTANTPTHTSTHIATDCD